MAGYSDCPMSSLARRWLLRIPSFRETSVRNMLLAQDIESERLDDLSEAFEEIAARAEQADAKAREVLVAAAPTLTDPAAEGRVEALREMAQVRGHFALARLLRRQHREPGHASPGPDERGGLDPKGGRALTLGERKFLARQHDRPMLDRLLRDPHPAVIKNLLINPRITETDVVRLAARRPTYRDIQSEIAKSQRWSTRPRIWVALVQNPYTPQTISIPLLSLLNRQDLSEVAHATDLPSVVRASALDLLDRRPPIPLSKVAPSQ